MTVIIPNLAISGFRSFGKTPQFFDRFTKINLFIGRNNAGKSNVIRFLSEIYPQAKNPIGSPIEALAHHLPDRPPMRIGIGDETIKSTGGASVLSDNHWLLKNKGDLFQSQRVSCIVAKVMDEKQRIDGTNLCWSLRTLPQRNEEDDSWQKAVKILSNDELQWLWSLNSGLTGGDRKHHWEPQVIKGLAIPLNDINIQVIPAVRQIGLKGSISEGFDGSGIIEPD